MVFCLAVPQCHAGVDGIAQITLLESCKTKVRNMVTSPTSEERGLLATACFLAIIGSLSLPHAAFHSLDRGIMVWILACLGSGLVASSIEPLTMRRALLNSALLSTVVLFTLLGFYVVRWVATRLKSGDADKVLIHFGSGGSIDLFDPRLIPVLMILCLLVMIATSIVIAVAMLAGKTIMSAIYTAYCFGPEGLLRIRRILVACTSIVTAALALWAAIS